MSEQLNNFLFDLARQRCLVLLQQLRLESPVAFALSDEFETTGRRFNGFLPLPFSLFASTSAAR
ncbi:TPA: hypothetical protein I8Y21_002587 [Klebsiella oxytoca]|uniref:Uncharacterized protein n=1 Tax=Klebsiella oxytoca TaxID=571 RepID=A0AAN5L8N0_KLEOX|nr:hypothetical protein [Klebsiella oxytoca]